MRCFVMFVTAVCILFLTKGQVAGIVPRTVHTKRFEEQVAGTKVN